MSELVLSQEKVVKQAPSGSFVSPYVEVVGHPDNKVPVGEEIELHVYYRATYPGQPWFAPEWTCSVVVYNEALTQILGQNDTTHLTEGPVSNDPYLTIGKMPSSAILVGIVLWANPNAGLKFPNDSGNWTQLDFRWLYIEPGQVAPPQWEQLATIQVSVKKKVVAWEQLATTQATVKKKAALTWEQLATTQATVKKGGQPSTEWVLLTQTSVSVKHEAFSIPPEFIKVLDIVYPEGKTYNGPAERAIAEFKLTPEQIPGTRWFAETVMAEKMASEVEAQGAKMLTLRVYENIQPTLWTEYILIAEATNPALPAKAVGSPLVWAPIIYAALAIVSIIVFYFFLLRPVTEFIYKSPGAAIGTGLILLGAGALAILGIAMYKGTSIKETVTGPKRR